MLTDGPGCAYNVCMEATTTPATTCRSCEVETRLFSDDLAVRQAVTTADRNHWSMWGCTCSVESAADAQSWFESVTR